MAVADVVEAMASHRPYRAALGIDSALHEIEQGRRPFAVCEMSTPLSGDWPQCT